MQSTSKNLTKTCLIACLGAVLSMASVGCQKDETPPPLPTSKPAPSASTVQLVVEDKEDAGKPEEKKKTGTGGGARRGALSACCSALRQNAANLPEPSKGHMLTAAAACDAANGAGTPIGAFTGTLSGLLRGAAMPPACR